MQSSTAPQKTRRILWLIGPQDAGREHLEVLRSCDVLTRTVSTPGEALDALRESQFDFAVADAELLRPLLAPLPPWQEAEILQRIEQGACLVGNDGRIVWSNAALEAQGPAVLDAVAAAARNYLEDLHSRPDDARSDRPRHETLTINRDRYYALELAPLSRRDGRTDHVVALLRDISAERRRQERMAVIEAAGRALVDLDAGAHPGMDVGDRLEMLQDRIIRFSRDLLHFDHFAIRVLDRATNRLDTVLASGFPEHAKSLEIHASPEGNGISGYVAATGRSYICDDVTQDPLYLPGLDAARASLTVPLILHDQVIGVFNVESEKPAAFTDEDRQFAEIFARYIAIALHILRLLAVERRVASGQIAADVDSEISRPMREVTSALERLIRDQPEDAPLRAELRTILGGVERMRAALHAVTHATGVSGLVPQASEYDPLLAGKRVLVADDEDTIREIVSDVLTRKGAIVVSARDGNEASELLRTQTYDLVLSDIKMPGKNGYEVFAAARAAREDCPVILITGFGYDPNHSIVRASREGLAGVLFKPFKVDQLLDQVRRALSGTPAG